MKKEAIINIDEHALFRIAERSLQFGLDPEHTLERVFDTIKTKKCAKRKHQSQKNSTYCKYFNDNLCFYVICNEEKLKDKILIEIKTLIIEKGRE